MSATSSNAVTISGPSHILDHLIRSETFKRSRPVRLPIYGPYHAPHLYNDASLATILESLPGDTDSFPTPRIPILSDDHEGLCNVSTFPQLLEGILQEILLKPLNWEKICKTCVADVQSSGSEQCDVVPIGLNTGGRSLVNVLKQDGGFAVHLDDRGSQAPVVPQCVSTTVSFNSNLEQLAASKIHLIPLHLVPLIQYWLFSCSLLTSIFAGASEPVQNRHYWHVRTVP